MLSSAQRCYCDGPTFFFCQQRCSQRAADRDGVMAMTGDVVGSSKLLEGQEWDESVVVGISCLINQMLNRYF